MEENIEQPNEVQKENKITVKNLFADRKKVLIWAIGIIFVLFLLFTLIGRQIIKNRSVSVSPIPSVNLTSPEATVYFDPSTINLTPGQTKTVDIYIDTWGKEISGANISVKYNPNAISKITLTQFRDRTSTVSLAFEPSSASDNSKTGTIVLPLIMAPTTPMQKGRGKVAVLTLTTKPSNATQTSINFSPSTAFITKSAQKVIVLQKGGLRVNYPIDGVFPTEPPQVSK